MSEFTRLTADEIAKHGTEYTWLHTRYEEMPESERRADVAILETMFYTPSLREYLRENYDIGVFANHESKQLVAGIAPRGVTADGMVPVDGRVTVPPLSLEQRAEIRTLLNLSSNNPAYAYEAIMAALGQPKETISIATDVSRDKLDA